MTILKVLLRLIKHFRIVDTNERLILETDVEAWEENNRKDPKGKVGELYNKAHEGVIARVLLCFAFFVGVKYFNEIMADPREEDLFDDED